MRIKSRDTYQCTEISGYEHSWYTAPTTRLSELDTFGHSVCTKIPPTCNLGTEGSKSNTMAVPMMFMIPKLKNTRKIWFNPSNQCQMIDCLCRSETEEISKA